MATEPNCTKKAEEALLRVRKEDNKTENIILDYQAKELEKTQKESKKVNELYNKPIKSEAPKYA